MVFFIFKKYIKHAVYLTNYTKNIVQSLPQKIVLDHTSCDGVHDHHTRLLLHGGLQDLKPTVHNTKGILHNHFPAADPLVEDNLIYVQNSAGEMLHQPGSERKLSSPRMK